MNNNINITANGVAMEFKKIGVYKIYSTLKGFYINYGGRRHYINEEFQCDNTLAPYLDGYCNYQFYGMIPPYSIYYKASFFIDDTITLYKRIK